MSPQAEIIQLLALLVQLRIYQSVSISERPYLVGIRAGSVLRAEEELQLSCSSLLLTSSPHLCFLWRVNGLQVWEDVSPLVVSDQIISTFSYTPAMEDHTVECSVVNATHLQSSLTTFSVTSNPTLVKLNRLEVSHKNILWVPFDAKQMKLSRKESSFEEETERPSRNIYNYFGEYYYKNSHRENKRNFKAEMAQPITMALISESPSSNSNSVQFIFASLLLISYL